MEVKVHGIAKLLVPYPGSKEKNSKGPRSQNIPLRYTLNNLRTPV